MPRFRGYPSRMKALLFAALASVSLALTACNTVKGFGEDISGTASWTQQKISGGGSDTVKASDAQYVQNPPQFPKSN